MEHGDLTRDGGGRDRYHQMDMTERANELQDVKSDECIGSESTGQPGVSLQSRKHEPQGEDVDVVRTVSPEEETNSDTNFAQEAATLHNRPNKADVLSVVIQKLTELVNNSERACTDGNDVNSGCQSDASTPPKVPEEKKRTRGKRQNKTHLYKCPNCPCLFAVRKRDLKKGRKILCVCCEKLRKAKAEATSPTERSPPQVVPLESWKVVCDVCSHWVSDYPSLLYHLASHPGVQILKCKLCDFVTAKHENMESHYKSAHHPKDTPNKFICSICSKFDTTDLAKMEEHLKSHDEHKLLVLKCSTCGYTCRSEEVLRYHMVTHVLETASAKGDGTPQPVDTMPFRCTVCGYSCDKLSTLKSHSWRHAGDESCDYPVGESADDNDCDRETEGPPSVISPAVNLQNAAPNGETGVDDKDSNLEDDGDLSRLAIGCCGQKGQTCCSKESTDKCHCESFDVPASQQPVLKVFFKEIVSKPTDIIIEGKSKDETGVSQYDASQLDQGASLGKSDVNEPKEEEEQKMKEVLEVCSSLINRLHCCAGKDTLVHPPSPANDSVIGGASSCAVCSRVSTGIETEEEGCVAGGPPGKVVVAPDPDMDVENEIMYVESIGMDNLPENTGSFVEVSTSDEPHLSSAEERITAPKRFLASNTGEEPCRKRQLLDDVAIGGGDALRPVSEKHIDADHTYQRDQSPVKLDCPFCNKILPDFKTLKRHLLDHCREHVLFKCHRCPSKFCTEALLAEHQTKHDEVQGGLVEDAPGEGGRNAGEGDSVKAPRAAGTTKSTMTCTVCDRKFRTRASLYIHERDCTARKKSFACFECDFIGVTKDEIDKHISESHKKPFKCALCNYISATPSGIKNHMKFHAVDKRYKCHLCDFSGAYPQSLKSHLKGHASCNKDDKSPCEQYKCKLCGYVSCHLPSMKTHMWRHARDPGFDYNAILDEIVKDATAVPPGNDQAAAQKGFVFIAPLPNPTPEELTSQIGATRKSAVQDSSREHQTVKVPRLIFKCTQCGFQSDTQAGLVDHLRGHLLQEDAVMS